MKRSIKHLPKCTQEELNILLELILKYMKGCEMVILYGSYARGNYVLWDRRVEYGVNTSYQSDLDILVVTEKSNIRTNEQAIRSKIRPKYNARLAHRRHPIPRIIVEYVKTLNEQLDLSQYFFTEIVRDGIKMYDTKNFKLAKSRELSFAEIKKIAVFEFDIHYPFGNDYLDTGYYLYNKERYVSGSFLLHQACERFYNSISLVFTNYRPKCHKLNELSEGVYDYSPDLHNVFPLNTDFEKHCYDLICRAYIEARYNPEFVVTKEEFVYLIERVEILKEITNRICTDQITSYDAQIQ